MNKRDSSPKRQFSLRSIFASLTIAALLIFFLTDNGSVSKGLLAILLINGLGFFAAYIVTQVLRFPRDGGYRDPEIRREAESKQKRTIRD